MDVRERHGRYVADVARWKPDARRRLEQAALDLFHAHGYDKTTVADIAAEAGFTSRTFFRHFPDEREVLFANSDLLRDQIEGALRAAPPDEPAFGTALDAAGSCAPTCSSVLADWSRDHAGEVLDALDSRSS